MGDIDLNQGTFTIENPDGSEEVIDIGTQTCPDPSEITFLNVGRPEDYI